MYLVAVLFFLLSLLGIFVQLFTLQTAQMFANQRAIGQAMLTWHSAAVGFARDNPPAAGSMPCGLITGVPGYAVSCPVTMTAANTVNVPKYLPADYSFADYQWYSVVYAPVAGSSQRYVVTFVPVPTSDDRLIETPPIGISIGDLMNQLRLLKMPNLAFGGVAETGTQKYLINNSSIQYLLDKDMPVGAVAIVSPI